MQMPDNERVGTRIDMNLTDPHHDEEVRRMKEQFLSTTFNRLAGPV